MDEILSGEMGRPWYYHHLGMVFRFDFCIFLSWTSAIYFPTLCLLKFGRSISRLLKILSCTFIQVISRTRGFGRATSKLIVCVIFSRNRSPSVADWAFNFGIINHYYFFLRSFFLDLELSLNLCCWYDPGKIPGTPNSRTSIPILLPYHSHVRIPRSTGMVWFWLIGVWFVA